MEAIEAQLERARELGTNYGLLHREHGRHEDSPLSGEWADEWTMTTVFAAVMQRPPRAVYDVDLAFELSEAFEEGYHAAALPDDDDRCGTCVIPEHDVCSLTPGCPCCDDTIARSAS